MSGPELDPRPSKRRLTRPRRELIQDWAAQQVGRVDLICGQKRSVLRWHPALLSAWARAVQGSEEADAVLLPDFDARIVRLALEWSSAGEVTVTHAEHLELMKLFGAMGNFRKVEHSLVEAAPSIQDFWSMADDAIAADGEVTKEASNDTAPLESDDDLIDLVSEDEEGETVNDASNGREGDDDVDGGQRENNEQRPVEDHDADAEEESEDDFDGSVASSTDTDDDDSEDEDYEPPAKKTVTDPSPNKNRAPDTTLNKNRAPELLPNKNPATDPSSLSKKIATDPSPTEPEQINDLQPEQINNLGPNTETPPPQPCRCPLGCKPKPFQCPFNLKIHLLTKHFADEILKFTDGPDPRQCSICRAAIYSEATLPRNKLALRLGYHYGIRHGKLDELIEAHSERERLRVSLAKRKKTAKKSQGKQAAKQVDRQQVPEGQERGIQPSQQEGVSEGQQTYAKSPQRGIRPGQQEGVSESSPRNPQNDVSKKKARRGGGAGVFACRFCRVRCGVRRDLLKHLANQHFRARLEAMPGGRELDCVTCGNRLNGRKALNQHHAIVHGRLWQLMSSREDRRYLEEMGWSWAPPKRSSN